MSDSPEEQKEEENTSKVSHPHNRFVISYFGKPKTARGVLEAFLPEEITSTLLLDKLEKMPGHFVDPDLAESETDLLFRAPTEAGEKAYIYFLIEHQRNPDSLMAYRVWLYIAMVYRELFSQKNLSPRGRFALCLPHGALSKRQRLGKRHLSGEPDQHRRIACWK